MGVKGVGEAGTIGCTPAVVNAVCDALTPLGIRHLDMPLKPERVWKAIREASARAALNPTTAAAGRGPRHAPVLGVLGRKTIASKATRRKA